MDLKSYFIILIGTVLVNNIVLVKILGLCPFMGVSKKLEASIGMAAATAFVLTVGSMTSWIIDHYLLQQFQLDICVLCHLLWLLPALCNSLKW